MQIQNKLTLMFTAIAGGLLLLFSIAIYITYAENREEEFFKQVRIQALTKANILLDAKVEPEVIQTIYLNTRNAMFQEEIAIYDTAFNLLYHDAIHIDIVKETPEMIQEIREKGEIRFFEDKWHVIGFSYFHEGEEYVITAAARDVYGIQSLQNLGYALTVAFFAVIILIFFGGRFFARQALKPVSELVDNVEEITATNLDLRVKEGNGKDEIAELAITFNRMLERLDSAFEQQKNVVSNIAHEIRNPLAAMIAELELAESRERKSEEYRQAIAFALNDAKNLSKLVSGLLDMAKADYDETEITFKSDRIDEVLMDAIAELRKNHSDFLVDITIDESVEDESQMMVKGNAYLLKTAFINLMDNACKFSNDKRCEVEISANEHYCSIAFIDNGPGIVKDDLPNVFSTFYRGKTVQKNNGYGIGLSLVKKIIDLHKGNITVHSEKGKGSVFTVELRVG
ncbi:MAG: sensor histidine kinase [Chitinophagaceae bacterium]|nr:MAG: sensor histidine kinase [Chitinophagaceae bacterium]